MHALAPQALTVKDFSKVYGIGRSLIYKEIAAGRLKTRKVGTRTLILRVDAEAWAEGLVSKRRSPGSAQ